MSLEVPPSEPPPAYDAVPWSASFGLPSPPADHDELRRILFEVYSKNHAVKQFFKDAEDRLARYSLHVSPPLVLLAGTVRVAFERRSLKKAQEPWRRGTSYSLPSPPLLWDIAAAPPSSFPAKDASVDARLPRSEERHPCSECSERGRTMCWVCHGTGRDRCGSCGGDGWRTESRWVETEPGVKRHDTVRERCGSCGGDGWRMCFTCGATGWVTCSDCDGSGGVVKYLVATIEWKTFDKNGLDVVDPAGIKVDPTDLALETARGDLPPLPADDQVDAKRAPDMLLTRMLAANSPGRLVLKDEVDPAGQRIPGLESLHTDLPPSTDRLLTTLRSSALASMTFLPPNTRVEHGARLLTVRTTVLAASAVRVDAVKRDRERSPSPAPGSPGKDQGGWNGWMKRMGWVSDKPDRWKGMYYVFGGGEGVEVFTNM
ncbi:hypothetical protein DFJ74DRAFT_37424 [Hyaloraphidium curvatum]|nr:hypothetical protein DFJ74DRAFT_37424 [Hyaloraphidium curvatum]